MKRKVFIGISSVLFGLVGMTFLNVHNAQEKYELTESQLRNLEALSSGPEEPEEPEWISCYSKSKKNDNAAYVDCASCRRIEGWEADGPAGERCDRKNQY